MLLTVMIHELLILHFSLITRDFPKKIGTRKYLFLGECRVYSFISEEAMKEYPNIGN
jgi:hypothetical protein